MRGQEIYSLQRAWKFQQDLIKRCSEYREIYESLIKEKIEGKSSEQINVSNENNVELPNYLSDEDNTLVPIKKNTLNVLNYNSDSDVE